MPQPVNGIALLCAWAPCSTAFLAFPSGIKRGVKYCSRACADLGNAEARTTHSILICAYPPCSKPFPVFASTLKRGSKARCCSRACKSHLAQLRLFSDEFAATFWAQALQGLPDTCWPWQGRRMPNGYGMVYAPGRKMDTGAHIVAWCLTHGRWPSPGMHICHACDNPPCCNPSHLWEGTQAQNIEDASRKGRNPRGERHGNSKLTDAQWQEALNLWRTGAWSLRGLAAHYGITHKALSLRLKRNGVSTTTKN